MIKVHHLNESRSQRILWLLEELELPYEVVKYERDANTRRAPDSLKKVHPLGKSPVITDGDKTVAETGAIIEYILRKYGKGKLMPAPDTDDYFTYAQWLHYAEGSAMTPFLMTLFNGFLGEAGAPLQPILDAECKKQLDYIDLTLSKQPYLMGAELTGADINLSFVLEAAGSRGWLKDYPALTDYVKRLQARAPYQRALETGGPYSFVMQA